MSHDVQVAASGALLQQFGCLLHQPQWSNAALLLSRWMNSKKKKKILVKHEPQVKWPKPPRERYHANVDLSKYKWLWTNCVRLLETINSLTACTSRTCRITLDLTSCLQLQHPTSPALFYSEMLWTRLRPAAGWFSCSRQNSAFPRSVFTLWESDRENTFTIPNWAE